MPVIQFSPVHFMCGCFFVNFASFQLLICATCQSFVSAHIFSIRSFSRWLQCVMSERINSAKIVDFRKFHLIFSRLLIAFSTSTENQSFSHTNDSKTHSNRLVFFFSCVNHDQQHSNMDGLGKQERKSDVNGPTKILLTCNYIS